MQDQSRLLLAISNVSASQIYEGEETVLAQGELRVALLSFRLDPLTPDEDMHAEGSTSSGQSSYPAEANPLRSSSSVSPEKRTFSADSDLFLHLSMGQNAFDFPLPASTKIIPQGKAAYLIPSQDLPNALIKLDLSASRTDELETFEILLSQFTAYEERPNDLARQDLVLVDSEDGRVVGSVPQENLIVNEDPSLQRSGHEKDPVLVDISVDPKTKKQTLTVSPAPEDYATKSSIVQVAGMISSGILFSSNALAKGIDSSANWYINRGPTSELPIKFEQSTLERVRRIHYLSNSAVAVSAKATGFLASAAHSLGSGIRHKFVSDGKPGKKPRLLNKSLIAFETIADTLDASTKQLLSTTSNAATTVVRHKYGDQAADVSHGIGSSIRNVGLVYVDARGVTRKALIKGAAKGMLFKAKVGNGEEVILGGEKVDASHPPSASVEASTSSGSSDIGGRQEDTSNYSSLDHPGTWATKSEDTSGKKNFLGRS